MQSGGGPLMETEQGAPAANQSLPERERVQGKMVEAFGADVSKRYALRYEVRELDQLVTSNTETGAINEAFPEELQPRDRTRAASQRQIDKMASSLVGDALTAEFSSLDRGAPIVGAGDAVVESGNARTMALRRAARDYPEQYAGYVESLQSAAEERGIEPEALEQYDQPVLVRVRVDQDVDRVEFAREANTAAVLSMSATERAQTDAQRLTTSDLVNLETSESGQGLGYDLKLATNREFIRKFVGRLPETERGEVISRTGELTQSGEQRIKAAMLTRVYGDPQLSDRIFEAREDPGMVRITKGLMKSLGPMARAEERIRSGQRREELSVTEDVAAAVSKLAGLKQEGLPVEMYLQQGKMFGEDLTETQRDIMVALHERRRSGKAVRELLTSWSDVVESQPHPQQTSFMTMDAPSREELIQSWLQGDQEEESAQGALF